MISRLLRSAGLPRGGRVLDLGCGKGAAAVQVARDLDARVLGIDACESFVAAARAFARRHGVADRCEFRVGDIRDRGCLPRTRFDAGLMLGVLPLRESASLLRLHVRRGGLYIIDDAVLDPTHPRADEFNSLPTREAGRAFLASLGETEARCLSPAPSQVRRLNESLYRRIERAAGALAREHPRLSRAIVEFLARQRRANTDLAGPTRPVTWVVRVG